MRAWSWTREHRARFRSESPERGPSRERLLGGALGCVVLRAFLQASAAFETTSLSPLQREIVILTVAQTNGCELCVVMHSSVVRRLGASALLDQMLAGTTLSDPQLEALRDFTRALMRSTGRVSAAELDAFIAADFTPAQALEVVAGIAAYTLSTYANRLTRAPIDPQLTGTAQSADVIG